MKRQLSNTNLAMIKGFVIGVCSLIFVGHGGIYWAMKVASDNSETTPFPSPLIILGIFPILYYVLVARFSTVEIDDHSLYHKSLFKKGEIPFQDLISVNPEWMGHKIFFKQAYGIVVRYRKSDNSTGKLTFLSKEINFGDASASIKELIELRKIINSKKV